MKSFDARIIDKQIRIFFSFIRFKLIEDIFFSGGRNRVIYTIEFLQDVIFVGESRNYLERFHFNAL